MPPEVVRIMPNLFTLFCTLCGFLATEGNSCREVNLGSFRCNDAAEVRICMDPWFTLWRWTDTNGVAGQLLKEREFGKKCSWLDWSTFSAFAWAWRALKMGTKIVRMIRIDRRTEHLPHTSVRVLPLGLPVRYRCSELMEFWLCVPLLLMARCLCTVQLYGSWLCELRT